MSEASTKKTMNSADTIRRISALITIFLVFKKDT